MLRCDRSYKSINNTVAKGLTEAEQATLKALGTVETICSGALPPRAKASPKAPDRAHYSPSDRLESFTNLKIDGLEASSPPEPTQFAGITTILALEVS